MAEERNGSVMRELQTVLVFLSVRAEFFGGCGWIVRWPSV